MRSMKPAFANLSKVLVEMLKRSAAAFLVSKAGLNGRLSLASLVSSGLSMTETIETESQPTRSQQGTK